MLSRSLDLYYLTEVCRLAFDFGDDYSVPVQNINKYGGVNISAPRSLFIDGEFDPWLHVTRHSPVASPLTDEGGYLIPGGGFASDRTALPNLADEPVHIRTAHLKQTSAVKRWIEEWNGLSARQRLAE